MHGLRQTQRGEVRIDGRGDDRIGKSDDIVVEAATLRPEQDAGALGPQPPLSQLARGTLGAQHRLHQLARARRSGKHEVELADRKLHALIDPRLIDEKGSTGSGCVRLVIRPAVAGRHQAQIGEPEIGHGAGGEADILPKLRPDEDDGRGRRLRCHARLRPLAAFGFCFHHGSTML